MEFKSEGNTFYSEGKKEEAIQAYTKGINLVTGTDSPADEDKGCLHLMYSNRSMVHLERCRVVEAMKDAESAIVAKPDYGKAYTRKAAVLLDEFKFEEALEALAQAEKLDPGLKTLEENKLRAKGKRWVHNCYLQKQLALQKEHNCDYVVLLEHKGKVIEEKVFFPRSDSGSESPIAAVAKYAIGTGKGGNGLLYVMEHSVGQSTLEKMKDSPNKVSAQILEQMKREFGPNSDVLKPFAQPPFKEYSLLRATFDSASLANPGNGVKPALPENGVLFPGAPKWTSLANIDKFADIALLTGDAAAVTATAGGSSASKPPPVSREDFRKTMKAHADKLETYRLESGLAGRETKCFGCGVAFLNPDPQECLCGEKYCSVVCYQKNWSQHAEACKTATSGIMEEVVWTAKYWLHAAEGHFQLKDEPHFVDQWKASRVAAAKAAGGAANAAPPLKDAEYQFYKQSEQNAIRAEVASFGCEEHKLTPHFPARPLYFMEIFWKWTMKMANPLATDTCARLMVKLEMCDAINMLASSQPAMPGVEYELPPATPMLAKQFREFIVKQKKTSEPGFNYFMQVLKKAEESA